MKIFLVIFLLLLSSPAIAEEEECIFDQKAQIEAYLELEKKYKGSTYIKEEYHLIIPTEEGEITLKRGGCVHFQVDVSIKIPLTDKYKDEDKLFKKVMELVTEFSYELIDLKKVKKIIKEKKWINRNPDSKDNTYYTLQYTGDGITTFDVYINHDKNHTTVTAFIYI